MLGRVTERTELIDAIAGPNTGWAVDDDMRTDPAVIPDLDARANNAESADVYALSDPCLWIDKRLRVDHSAISL
jgi:hypothetical protein